MMRVLKIGVGSQIGAGLSGYVAELCASMICADLGLPTSLHDSHASYVSHWIGIMRADSSAIFTAAAKAEQAFAYLRGFSAPVTSEASSPAALAA
jgi:antirestriction protein ArdC